MRKTIVISTALLVFYSFFSGSLLHARKKVKFPSKEAQTKLNMLTKRKLSKRKKLLILRKRKVAQRMKYKKRYSALKNFRKTQLARMKRIIQWIRRHHKARRAKHK